MFTWKVEEMKLRNQKGGIVLGNELIFDGESKVSREDKIAFVDSMQDGKLSYLLELIEKFNEEKGQLPKDKWGEDVKTVSLKAWIKRNDTKSMINSNHWCGLYDLLGSRRYINHNWKGQYDTYDDVVNEVFHRQLKECKKEEEKYFHEHDEYSILKEKFRNKSYNTTFGANIGMFSDGTIGVISDDNRVREITMDELKLLLSKYDELEAFEKQLAEDVNITY